MCYNIKKLVYLLRETRKQEKNIKWDKWTNVYFLR